MPESIRQSLSAVLEYVAEDEFKSYLQATPDEKTNHVFESVLKIQRWLAKPPGSIEHFGSCPHCGDGGNDGFLNLRRQQWFVCHLHRIKWHVGDNMFRSWRNESEADWLRNWAILQNYKEILYPTGAD